MKIVLVLLLVATLVGSWIAADRLPVGDEPIGRGSFFGSEGEHRFITPAGDSGSVVYRYQPGHKFSYTFAIRNSDWRTIHVTGLPLPGDFRHHVATEIGNGSKGERMGSSARRFEPFKPFEIKPGEYRYIRLSFRFQECRIHERIGKAHPRETFHSGPGWDYQKVEFAVWGFAQRADAELMYDVGLEGIASPDCLTKAGR